MTQHSKRKKHYMPGLDGLRALSVLAVIAYHLNVNGTPGGFLGVGVFFVLSGYLITDQLVSKWQRDRTLDLKTFWIRRARRLLPAMLLMIATVSAYLAITDPARLSGLRGDVGSAITYVNNWWLIYHNVSYFDSFGPPSPFGHFWSLAVEEQFYLVWPIVLLIALTFTPRRGRLAALILFWAAASAVLMAMLYSPGSDPSRVYYGSDTRAFGLLIGAALAIVWPSRKLTEKPLSRSGRGALDAVGVLSLAAIGYMVAKMAEYDPFVYRGGLVLLSVATALLVAVLAHPQSRLAKAMAIKPLRWLGTRSYGIYLWHFPVIALSTPVVDTGGFNYGRAALQFIASLVLAALSWKFVEEPILQGAWKSRAAQAIAAFRQNGRSRRQAIAVLATSLTIVLCVSCVGTGGPGQVGAGGLTSEAAGTANAVSDSAGSSGDALPHDPSPSASASQTTGGDPVDATPAAPSAGDEGAASSPGDSAAADGSVPPTSSANGPSTPAADSANAAGSAKGTQPPATGTAVKQGPEGNGAAGAGSKTAAGSAGGSSANAKPGAGTPAPRSGKGVTVIGDSVILGVKPYLEKLMPGILVDGKVGRQLNQADDTIDALSKAGQLGDVVVLELGTNGPFTKKKLTALLDSIGKDRTILLINTRVPRKWEGEVNDLLKETAGDYPNAKLVDWYANSSNQDAYFGKDGVHPTRTGAEAYASMVEKSLAPLI